MWYAVYDNKTKKLISTGTVLGENLSKDYSVIELGEDFDQDANVWDENTLGFKPFELPVIKTKEEVKTATIDEIIASLNLPKAQLDEVKVVLEQKL